MRRPRSATAARSKPARLPEPEINVTPLVDVVLVLLIIFMVIAPNLQQGTPVTMPEVRRVDDDALEGALEVVLDAKGQYHIDDSALSSVEVFERVADARAEDPERPLVLKADATLPYGAVRDAFAALQRAGVGTISLKVTAQDGEES